MEGPSKLNDTFQFIINSNYKKDSGILNIDAKGLLKDVTHQGYDNSLGEGLVVESGDIGKALCA